MAYEQRVQNLNEQIFSKMKLCSYTLNCHEFTIDFTKKSKKIETYKLYHDKEALKSYYPLPGSQKNLLVILLEQQKYQKQIDAIKASVYKEVAIVEVVVFILSILFSLFSLRPLYKALHLTEEFIRDILHDFNTPISTILLNVSMMQKRYKDDPKFHRITAAIETLLMLQQNLKSYLHQSIVEDEVFKLNELVKTRVDSLAKNQKNIQIIFDIPNNIAVKTNKESFIRIIDNIVSNAIKYNKPNGSVTLSYHGKKLIIEDSGIGIKNPSRVFERFYKEHERGIGIGLHIVQKLCKHLNISISVESEVGVGSKFVLDLSKIVL